MTIAMLCPALAKQGVFLYHDIGPPASQVAMLKYRFEIHGKDRTVHHPN